MVGRITHHLMLKSLDGIQIITAESEKKVKLTSSPIVEYQQYRWM